VEIEPEDDEIPQGMDRQEAIEAAAQNLADLCGGLLDRIEENEKDPEDEDARSPWQLRYIMNIAYDATKDKFPGHEHSAASALFFLRLITPTITMGGKNFGLELDQNKLKTRRRLTTLVGKIVQYVANAVVPDGMPEPITKFIEHRISDNKDFMKFIAGRAPVNITQASAKSMSHGEVELRFPTAMTGEVYEAAMTPMVDFCVQHEKVLSFDGIDNKSALQEEIKDAVRALLTEANGKPNLNPNPNPNPNSKWNPFYQRPM